MRHISEHAFDQVQHQTRNRGFSFNQLSTKIPAFSSQTDALVHLKLECLLSSGPVDGADAYGEVP